MELVPVVGSGLAAALAAAVCVRRAKLGRQMDRSLEVLKSSPGRATPRRIAARRVAPVPRPVWSQAVSDGREPPGSTARIPAGVIPVSAQNLQPPVPRAS